MKTAGRLLAAGVMLAPLAAVVWNEPARASHQSCECHERICSADGFEKSLVSFTMNQDAGTTEFVYEICNQARGMRQCADGVCVEGGRNGMGCSSDDDCPGGSCSMGNSGGIGVPGDDCTTNTDCAGLCVPCAPPHNLSHVDIVLPSLGECLSETQQVSIQQLGCPACDPVLSCLKADSDPACPAVLCEAGTGGKFCQGGSNAGKACNNNQDCGCAPGPGCASPCTEVPCQAVSTARCVGGENDGDPCTTDDNCPNGVCQVPPLQVLKCNVASGSLDPGECVTVQVTIGGETPNLGSGQIEEVTKAGTLCTSDEICGPACDCSEELPEGCLTRSPGFWGTHPAITSLFLPITVCGVSLTSTSAGSCSSVTEALCVSPGLEANRKLDRNPAYAQLVRQLAAAKLNIAATEANGGSCESVLPAARIAECETKCGGTKQQILNSNCIADLDAFNNSEDTLSTTPPPFDAPGRAEPAECQKANGNCVVISKRCTPGCP